MLTQLRRSPLLPPAWGARALEGPKTTSEHTPNPKGPTGAGQRGPKGLGVQERRSTERL